MSEITTNTTTAAAAPAKRKTAPRKKKAATKAKSSKSTKGAKSKKKVAKKSSGGHKRNGLANPQVRILEALVKSRRSLNRSEISKSGKVDLAMLNSYLGAHNEQIRAKNDKKVMKSLLTLKLVKYAAEEEEGHGAYYTITPAGKKALGAARKSAKK